MTAIVHRGRPVQFGAEKEMRLEGLKAGKAVFADTDASRFDPKVFGEQVPSDFLLDKVAKPAGEVKWDQLNDAGKARYALRFRETKGDFPKITPDAGSDFSKIEFESNGWIEVISPKLDTLDQLKAFTNDYGWGHVHVSFMRGQPAEKQQEMLSWLAVSNVWSFVEALEERGAKGNGEDTWRYAIKGLSTPTEEHLMRYGDMLGGKDRTATAFSKHLVVNLRAKRMGYGEPDRIGVEVRGGVSSEKKVILDSLLDGLSDDEGARGAFGSKPFAWGSNDFRLPRLGKDARSSSKGTLLQVKSLPSDFQTMLSEHLAEYGGAGDAAQMYRFVAGASLSERPRSARLDAFDQRACIPLLKYEALPFLDDAAKQRAVEARGRFVAGLDALARQGARGVEAGRAFAKLTETWAKDARLGASLRSFMTGGKAFL